MEPVNDNEMLLGMLIDGDQDPTSTEPSMSNSNGYDNYNGDNDNGDYGNDGTVEYEEEEEYASGSEEAFTESGSDTEDDEITRKAINTEKRMIMMKLRRLEARHNIKLDINLSMHSSLNDLRAEHEAICRSIGTEGAIDMMKQTIVLVCTGIERFNNVYDPFSVYLDGWSATVSTTVDTQEELLEELYDKYYSTIAQTGPEFRLIFALTMSAVMYNVKNKIISPQNTSFLGKLAKDHARGLQNPQEQEVDLNKIKWD